ncbi:winged helix-turn-helix transcriptional regulator [Planctomycetales bacterium ZRK34]|nr:winged helix-turn-helix transcriptional regulator [Planctomycetales bacterium ZRK34]
MTRPLLSEADRADVFRGVAHPLRRKVLHLLGEGELSVTQMLTAAQVALPTLSAHLAVLRETGLVSQRVVGQRRLYRLRPAALRSITRWVDSVKG